MTQTVRQRVLTLTSRDVNLEHLVGFGFLFFIYYFFLNSSLTTGNSPEPPLEKNRVVQVWSRIRRRKSFGDLWWLTEFPQDWNHRGRRAQVVWSQSVKWNQQQWLPCKTAGWKRRGRRSTVVSHLPTAPPRSAAAAGSSLCRTGSSNSSEVLTKVILPKALIWRSHSHSYRQTSSQRLLILLQPLQHPHLKNKMHFGTLWQFITRFSRWSDKTKSTTHDCREIVHLFI